MHETSAEKPLTVRVISEAIGDYLSKLGPVWIEGELSEVTVRPGAAHGLHATSRPQCRHESLHYVP